MDDFDLGWAAYYADYPEDMLQSLEWLNGWRAADEAYMLSVELGE